MPDQIAAVPDRLPVWSPLVGSSQTSHGQHPVPACKLQPNTRRTRKPLLPSPHHIFFPLLPPLTHTGTLHYPTIPPSSSSPLRRRRRHLHFTKTRRILVNTAAKAPLLHSQRPPKPQHHWRPPPRALVPPAPDPPSQVCALRSGLNLSVVDFC